MLLLLMLVDPFVANLNSSDVCVVHVQFICFSIVLHACHLAVSRVCACHRGLTGTYMGKASEKVEDMCMCV